MGRFYNTTRGILLSIGPKQWGTIARDEENSAQVQKAVRKGFLVRTKIAGEVAPTVAPVVAPTTVIATPVVAPLREDPKIEVVAESVPLVQNQFSKSSFPSKAKSFSKTDSEEMLSDEPRRKKE